MGRNFLSNAHPNYHISQTSNSLKPPTPSTPFGPVQLNRLLFENPNSIVNILRKDDLITSGEGAGLTARAVTDNPTNLGHF